MLSSNSSPNQLIIKFDSACSRNMSGNPSRLTPSSVQPVDNIRVKGFNNTISPASSIGLNEDNKSELLVPSMPSNLVLLSAHDYAKDGCALLFKDFGFLIKLTESEKESFIQSLVSTYPITKFLKVVNNTYEVVNLTDHISSSTRVPSNFSVIESANSSTASRYFNSKIHVTNPEERVLATLLTGLSFSDIYSHLKNNSLLGFPRDLTIQSMNRFEHNYGRSPETLQLAYPNLDGHKKGYLAPPDKLTHVAQRGEADYFFCQINQDSIDSNDILLNDSSPQPAKTKKLPSHGGATAAFVGVDAYSGYVYGELVPNLKRSLDRVKNFHNHFLSHGHHLEKFAADVGIITESKFRVMQPDVQKFLLSQHITFECGEAYNHNNGTSHVEETIKQIKQLICFAFLYILNNPQFDQIGFTRLQILKLWGEIFYWSIAVINLKPSPNDNSKSRYEVFLRVVPDLRNIRLFPIFAIVYVLRRKDNELMNSKKYFWQRGLYVGPSPTVKGCIRVAVRTNSTIQIITSSCIKCVTDGGDLPHISNKNSSQHIFNLLDTNVDFSIPGDPNVINPPQHFEFTDTTSNPDEVTNIPPIVQSNILSSPNLRGDDELFEQSISYPPEPASVPLLNSSNDIILSNNNISNQTQPSNPPLLPSPSSNSLEQTTISSSELRGGKTVRFLDNHQSPDEKDINNNNNKSNNNKRTTYEEKIKQVLASTDHLSRTERMNIRNKLRERNIFKDNNKFTSSSAEILENCNFTDWSTHTDEDYYFCFSLNCYIKINGDTKTIKDYKNINEFARDIFPRRKEDLDEEYLSYKAITENVPRTFDKALKDAVWGTPAQSELNTVSEETKCIVKIPTELALDHIRAGAEVLYLIPVYEEKIKEGKLVRKVRLVADGRTNKIYGSTYSPTPTKEEFFILLHIFSALDWDYYLIDEERAFLQAKKQDKNIRLAKFRGSKEYYQILGALYGTKDACRDYDASSSDKLIKLGFQRLHLCSCIFYRYCENYNEVTKQVENAVIFIYKHVDDYFIGGNSNDVTLDFIINFRQNHAKTSTPIKNPIAVLGMELRRDLTKSIVLVTMQKKIKEVCDKYLQDEKVCHIPLPSECYLIHDYEFESLNPDRSRFLDTPEEKELYLTLVGILIWVQGCRLDIIFAVLYLSWSTNKPRQHHLNMAYYVLRYLRTTIDIPLVLGGNKNLQSTTYSDASLGTAPKGRSVIGVVNKLNPDSGAISAKATAGPTVHLSSFESELEGMTVNFKSNNRIMNILKELNVELIYSILGLQSLYNPQGQSYNDNESMLNFVKGDAIAKGVRHMALRLWYNKTEYQKGSIKLDYMSGKEIPADFLTKPSCKSTHRKFTIAIMGLKLTGLDYFT